MQKAGLIGFSVSKSNGYFSVCTCMHCIWVVAKGGLFKWQRFAYWHKFWGLFKDSGDSFQTGFIVASQFVEKCLKCISGGYDESVSKDSFICKVFRLSPDLFYFEVFWSPNFLIFFWLPLSLLSLTPPRLGNCKSSYRSFSLLILSGTGQNVALHAFSAARHFDQRITKKIKMLFNSVFFIHWMAQCFCFVFCLFFSLLNFLFYVEYDCTVGFLFRAVVFGGECSLYKTSCDFRFLWPLHWGVTGGHRPLK